MMSFTDSRSFADPFYQEERLMTNRILLIYNPIAGKGGFLSRLSDVIDMFTKAGFLVEVYPTQSAGDATRRVEQLSDEYYMIVPAGGDGTLDEIVTGLIRGNRNIPIGYIPVGSTNDYATSLGLSTNVIEAVGDIINGVPHGVDAGLLNGEHMFIYVAAFGAFTDVAYQTNQDMKKALGHVAYLLEATKRLAELKCYTVHVKTEHFETTEDYIFGMVTNSISVGGIKNITGQEVQLDDGEFEVTLVHHPKSVMEVQEIVGCLLTQNYDTDLVDYFKASALTLTCEQEIPWTLDGEYGGIYKKVDILNRRKRIRIMLDKDNPTITHQHPKKNLFQELMDGITKKKG